jgi:Ulp1 family protease
VKRKRKRTTAQTTVVVTTEGSRLTTTLQNILRPSVDQTLLGDLRDIFAEHRAEQSTYRRQNPEYHERMRDAQNRGLTMPTELPPVYDTRTFVTLGRFDMSVKKLSCLLTGVWLNDEVVNCYFDMIKKRNTQSVRVWNRDYPTLQKKNSLFLATFFIAKLLEGGRYNYPLVRRWTKYSNIFDLDKIFVPINIDNSHWALVVVFMMFKEIHYYDRYVIWVKDVSFSLQGSLSFTYPSSPFHSTA